MKRVFSFLILVSGLVACDEQSTGTQTKIDSKLDSLSNKVGKETKAAWDSTKADAKKLKDKVEDKLQRIQDSTHFKNKDSVYRP